jgi:hypothetical protein
MVFGNFALPSYGLYRRKSLAVLHFDEARGGLNDSGTRTCGKRAAGPTPEYGSPGAQNRLAGVRGAAPHLLWTSVRYYERMSTNNLREISAAASKQPGS